ncbi:MAG: hypothetical protein H6592_10935 [Flavobacteriales bacterium]|nr:hypothetical protein [Flavobacteriales bacterium]
MLVALILMFLLGVGFLVANHGLVIYVMLRIYRQDLTPFKAFLLSAILSCVTSALVIYFGLWIPAEEIYEHREALVQKGEDPGPIISRLLLSIAELLVGAGFVVLAIKKSIESMRFGQRRRSNVLGLVFLVIHAVVILLGFAVLLLGI